MFNLITRETVRKILLGSLVGGGFVLGSFVMSPSTENLSDIPVRSDYLRTDSLFVDAVVMLKPYRDWGQQDNFDRLVQLCDRLAFYLQQASDREAVPELRLQHYSLNTKREIAVVAENIVKKVSSISPEEAEVAKDNKDALLTVVDTYVDSIQNECRDNARRL